MEEYNILVFALVFMTIAVVRTARKDIMYFANKCEIIGNVFDNPELLKDGRRIMK